MSQTPEQILASLSSMMGAGSPLFRDTSLMAKVLAEAAKNQTKLNGLSDKEIKLIEEKLKADDEYAVKVRQRSQNMAQGANQLGKTVASAVKDMGSLASKVSASTEGFTAVIPVVQMLGNTTKGVVEALGKMASGISIFGFSTGRASEGLSQMAGIGIDLVTGALTQQLEGTQKIVNSYVLMSKAGVTFGGSLESMKIAAHSSGMSIDTFGKFITKNYEQFGLLTGNVTEAATRVGTMTKNISNSNPKILAMYGSMEELGNATADYMAMQARYGIDTTKNTKELTLGATEYLVAQKELTALTGKSAEALKKSEEERQNSAAYQIAMMKMEPQQRENTRKALELIEARYGKEAAKVAMESVSRNGEIISQTGLQLGALNPALVQTMQDMLGMTKQPQEQFNKSTAQLIQDRRGMITQEQLQYSELFKNQVSGYGNPMIEMLQNVTASTLKSQTAQGDSVKTAAQIEADRKKSADLGTQAFAGVITQLELFKVRMDDVFLKRMLATDGSFAKMMDSLFDIANASVSMLDKLNGVMPRLMSGFARALKALDELGTGKGDLPDFQQPSSTVGMDMGGAEIATAGQAQLTSAERANTGQAQLASTIMHRMTADALTTGMANYKWGGGHGADSGLSGIDCSGWILHLNREMMKKVNAEAGKPVYSEEAMKLFQSGAAGTIIANVQKAGGGLIVKSLKDLNVNDLKEGMLLGQHVPEWTGKKSGSGTMGGGIQHIAQVVKGPDGQLYISESGGMGAEGRGAHLKSIKEWQGLQPKSSEFSITDPTQLAKRAGGGPVLVGENGPEILSGDGRMVTSTAATNAIFTTMNDTLMEVLSVLKSSKSISENILQATA